MHPDVFPCLYTGVFSDWTRHNSIWRLWTQGATKLKFICFHWHQVNPSFVDSFAAQTQSVIAVNGFIWWVLSMSDSKPNIAGTNGVTEVVVSVTTEACCGGFCHCQRPLMELEPLSSFLFLLIIWISSVLSPLPYLRSQSQREWVTGPITFLQFY